MNAPAGHSNGLIAPAGARLLFVAGQAAAVDRDVPAADFGDPFDLALAWCVSVVRAAGDDPTDMARIVPAVKAALP